MNKYSKISIIASVAMLPLAMLAGNIVSIYFKSTNPNDVDVTAGLAYLRHILLTAIFVILILFIISLVSAIKGYKDSLQSSDRYFALIIFALTVVLVLGVTITNSINSAIIDNAQREKEQNSAKRLD